VYFHGNGKPWITVGEITKDSDIYLYSTSTRLTQEGTLHSRSIDIGTLLLTNSGATLGIPKISCIKGCINDGVAAFLNLRSDVNKEYLYFYWARQTIHLKAWVDLGAQPNLNTQIIGGWPVLVPPIEEQNQIVNYVKLETGLISKAIKEAESEISLLHEYRKRLIADVVTGKLDVREEAANLPEESQATETFEDTISEDNGLDNDEIEDDQTGELEKEVLA
jgi:type I restriction enzyme S subunit